MKIIGRYIFLDEICVKKHVTYSILGYDETKNRYVTYNILSYDETKDRYVTYSILSYDETGKTKDGYLVASEIHPGEISFWQESVVPDITDLILTKHGYITR